MSDESRDEPRVDPVFGDPTAPSEPLPDVTRPL